MRAFFSRKEHKKMAHSWHLIEELITNTYYNFHVVQVLQPVLAWLFLNVYMHGSNACIRKMRSAIARGKCSLPDNVGVVILLENCGVFLIELYVYSCICN